MKKLFLVGYAPVPIAPGIGFASVQISEVADIPFLDIIGLLDALSESKHNVQYHLEEFAAFHADQEGVYTLYSNESGGVVLLWADDTDDATSIAANLAAMTGENQRRAKEIGIANINLN